MAKFKFDFVKYRALLKRGLCSGPVDGNRVCIEVACAIALGEETDPKDDDEQQHSKMDQPSCVHSTLTRWKISLNDCHWSSDQARSKAMRILGVAQLGTKDTSVFSFHVFETTLEDLLSIKVFPSVLRKTKEPKDVIEFYTSGKFMKPSSLEAKALEDHEDWAFLGCEDFFDSDISTLTQKELFVVADCMVEALRKAKSPGIKLLKKL